MPLSHKEISDLLASATTEAARLVEYRQATHATVVRLHDDMAAALGASTGYRRLTPFLGTVVQTIAAKLEVEAERLKLSKARDTKLLGQWLGDTQWSIIERDLYEAVSRDACAYVLVRWGDTGPDFTVREQSDGTTGAGHVCVAGVIQFAYNGWKDGDQLYLDVYFPDRIEKYARKAEQRWEPRQDTPDEEWPIPWVDAANQPLGIALVPFSIGKSDIDDAVQLGRDMNEALLDITAASRVQGWPQRYLKGERNPGILTNENGQPIFNAWGRPFPRTVQTTPGSIMTLSGNAELGQLDPAQPNTAVLDKLLELISWATTVPSHYFTGQWPSGVALIQAESRLNARVEDHQGRLSSSIVAMLRLAMRLSNLFAGTALDPEQPIEIPWCSPEIETEDLRLAREQAVTANVTSLVAAKLMSRYTALQALHPDWDDAQVQEELTRLDAEAPEPQAQPQPPLPTV